jgi:hypothetical protein
VETLVARTPGDPAARRPVRIVPTNFDVARQVGAILNSAKVGSRYPADAHMVAAKPGVSQYLEGSRGVNAGVTGQ